MKKLSVAIALAISLFWVTEASAQCQGGGVGANFQRFTSTSVGYNAGGVGTCNGGMVGANFSPFTGNVGGVGYNGFGFNAGLGYGGAGFNTFNPFFSNHFNNHAFFNRGIGIHPHAGFGIHGLAIGHHAGNPFFRGSNRHH